MPRRERKPARSRRLPFPMVLGGLLFALVLATVWSHARVDRMQQELSLERANTRALSGTVEMRSQATRRYTSHREVVARAARDLDLVATDSERVIHLEFENHGDPAVPALDDLVPEAYASESAEGR